MLNFLCHIPTRVLFGRNQIEQLAEEVKRYSRRILVVTGRESVKKYGIYQRAAGILKKAGITYFDLSGIKPNPLLSRVYEGIELCRKENIDFVLAVGSGSVIDTAKTIAAGVKYKGDVWDFYLKKAKPRDCLGVGTVLTLAAAGSETSVNAVITNEKTQRKLAFGSFLIRPKFSILDPVYTFTVPRIHSAAGIVDIMSHVFEQYFSPTRSAGVQDRISEAILKTCIHYGPVVLKEPKNYEARANIMWAGSLALNGFLGLGKIEDWATHRIEHEVSAIYDLTHGIGLAIIFPNWMKYVLNEEAVPMFSDYGNNVWGLGRNKNPLEISKQAILKTKGFFAGLGAAVSLKEAGINEERLEEMSKKAVSFGELGEVKKLNDRDVLNILKMSL
ncbi:MAG: iron-containing alcohol dehydrogenase [Candidatus Omnitrophota bacterium]|nr:iron-containing alcohol dehydrogenase [Candidatus Omnitrophota bacterium]